MREPFPPVTNGGEGTQPDRVPRAVLPTPPGKVLEDSVQRSRDRGISRRNHPSNACCETCSAASIERRAYRTYCVWSVGPPPVAHTGGPCRPTSVPTRS